MRTTTIIAMLGFAALIISGCAKGGGSYVGKPAKSVPPASVPAGSEASLFPLKVGNQWTYTIDVRRSNGQQSASSTDEVTMRVAKVVPSGDGVQATIEIMNAAGKVTQSSTWRLDKKGIYELAGGVPPKPYTPPYTQLAFPVNTGGTFSWKGSGPTAAGPVGNSDSKYKVLAPQEIDTDQGRMSAIPVESKTTFSLKDDKGKTLTGASIATCYWVPNVGIARYRSDWQVGSLQESQTLRLKASVLK